MPQPSSALKDDPNFTIPSDFDPDKHCGAVRTKAMTVCMSTAGLGTDHYGQGRCSAHGGITTIVTNGHRSLVPMIKGGMARGAIWQRAAEIKNSDELLSLDNEIAFAKSVGEMKMKEFSENVEQYLKVREFLQKQKESGAYGDGEPPPMEALMPNVPTEELKLIQQLVGQGYNMRYTTRFTMPITEVESLIRQIGEAFTDVCSHYNLPPEVRMAFAKKLASLKSSKPLTDPQLDRAGLGPDRMTIYDPEVVSVYDDAVEQGEEWED